MKMIEPKLFPNGDQIFCQETEIVINFVDSRTVLCTSPLGGGIRRDLTGVYNHCDKNYKTGECNMKGKTYLEHLQVVAKDMGLDPKETAGLSTACPMEAVEMRKGTACGIPITAIVTGGIDKNGRCAGDKADMWEEEGVYQIVQSKEKVIPESGTINIILHVDADLTDGALAGALMVATEAKAATIRDAELKSVYSDKIATGSGTDGVIIIANPNAERKITQVRTDTILGQVIARTIKKALAISMKESAEIIKVYDELFEKWGKYHNSPIYL